MDSCEGKIFFTHGSCKLTKDNPEDILQSNVHLKQDMFGQGEQDDEKSPL